MMDNLYLDKLKGKIDDDQYDQFYQSFVAKKEDINARLGQLQEAEDNYYITAKYILELANKAYEYFLSSEVEEKRQLIKLVLPNVLLDGKKLVLDVQKPFDEIIKAHEGYSWRSFIDALRNNEIKFSFSLSNIQTVCKSLNLQID